MINLHDEYSLRLYNKIYNMQNYPTIQAQIDTINKATEEASKSKESALKFLYDAGIIRDEKPAVSTKPKDHK